MLWEDTLAGWLIEGAGLALVGVLTTGILAILANRQRLIAGIALGMALALLVLPFVAYVVAALTHHLATDADLTPPTFIVVTSIVCAVFSLLGLLGGLLAEHRASRRPLPLPPTTPPDLPEYDGIDDPKRWLPWHATRR